MNTVNGIVIALCVTDGSSTCGEQSTREREVESPSRTPENNVTLCQLYWEKKKKKGLLQTCLLLLVWFRSNLWLTRSNLWLTSHMTGCTWKWGKWCHISSTFCFLETDIWGNCLSFYPWFLGLGLMPVSAGLLLPDLHLQFRACRTWPLVLITFILKAQCLSCGFQHAFLDAVGPIIPSPTRPLQLLYVS